MDQACSRCAPGVSHGVVLAWSWRVSWRASGALRPCSWRASGALHPCSWRGYSRATGVLLLRFWRAPPVLLACLLACSWRGSWRALGMLLGCFWRPAPGVSSGVLLAWLLACSGCFWRAPPCSWRVFWRASGWLLACSGRASGVGQARARAKPGPGPRPGPRAQGQGQRQRQSQASARPRPGQGQGPRLGQGLLPDFCQNTAKLLPGGKRQARNSTRNSMKMKSCSQIPLKLFKSIELQIELQAISFASWLWLGCAWGRHWGRACGCGPQQRAQGLWQGRGLGRDPGAGWSENEQKSRRARSACLAITWVLPMVSPNKNPNK